MTTPTLESARAELAILGLTDEQMDTVTGFGLRHNGRCKPVDTVLNKYAAGALTATGVMSVLYGHDSPQHREGTARFVADRIAANRLAKAHKLVDALVAAGATVADFAIIPWDDAAAAAGVRPPSDETKQVVRRLLAVIEDVNARHGADPFAGL